MKNKLITRILLLSLGIASITTFTSNSINTVKAGGTYYCIKALGHICNHGSGDFPNMKMVKVSSDDTPDDSDTPNNDHNI
ncbi:hypothetical protein ACWGOQ_0006275 [Aquimarina sp. M1]